jgi:hypothetical protein
VFRRRGSLEEYRRSPAGRAATAPAEVERVFMLVDGRSSVRRVIDLSRLGTFEAMRTLVQLVRGGWLEPVSTRRSADARGSAPMPGSEPRRRVALVAPFALLAVLALLAPWTRTLHGGDPLALPAGVLARARTHFDAVRARSLVLAHRHANGRWAGGLDEVAQWASDSALALTPSERGAYYVGRRDEGPIVLAPDR